MAFDPSARELRLLVVEHKAAERFWIDAERAVVVFVFDRRGRLIARGQIERRIEGFATGSAAELQQFDELREVALIDFARRALVLHANRGGFADDFSDHA